MIYLYSGTPGSGKSLHTAEVLYWWIRQGRPAICNFEINLNMIKTSHEKKFYYKNNLEITPEYLMQFSKDYFGTGKIKESSILLVIDECQLMFNAREWDKTGRAKWLSFFTQHRHFGYDIILVAQFDRMIDRQIRSLIEYEFVHRKVTNYGWRGFLLCLVFLSPKLFVYVKMWYPLRQKMGSQFFRCRKKYYKIYDTFLLLDAPD